MQTAILAGALGTRLSKETYNKPMDTLRDKNNLERLWSIDEAPSKLYE